MPPHFIGVAIDKISSRNRFVDVSSDSINIALWFVAFILNVTSTNNICDKHACSWVIGIGLGNDQTAYCVGNGSSVAT